MIPTIIQVQIQTLKQSFSRYKQTLAIIVRLRENETYFRITR